MKLILIGIYLFIGCIASIVIMLIRGRRVSYAAGDRENADIIDKLSGYNRRRLAAKPWNMRYEVYTAIATIAAIVLAVFGYLYRGVTWAVVLGLVGLFVPEIIVKIQSASQKQQFEERFACGLRQLSAAMKSGMSLYQAVEDVSKSPFVHDQIRAEFEQLQSELTLGVSIQDAFDHFADRIASVDARDVAIAIKMQSKVGGREGAVIEGIAKNISDRMMLRKEINSLFSGSKMTILVLDILPFAVVAFLVFGMSDFMQLYFSSVTMLILFIGLLAIMGVGSIVTHAMVNKMRRESGIC